MSDQDEGPVKRRKPSLQMQFANAAVRCFLFYGNNVIVPQIRKQTAYAAALDFSGQIVLRKNDDDDESIDMPYFHFECFEYENLLRAIVNGSHAACMAKIAMEKLFCGDSFFLLALGAQLSQELGYHVVVSYSVDEDDDVKLDIDCRMRDVEEK